MEDNDSYAVQHFGVSPRNVADSMYNIWFDYTERCLDALKVSMRDRTDVPLDVVESTVGAVFQAMIPEMNREANKLEELLRQEIMHIPPHVLLPEDEVHREGPRAAQGVASLRQQLDAVRKRLAEEARQQEDLEAELAQQKLMQQQLKSTLATIQEMSGAASTGEAVVTSASSSPQGI